MNEILSGGPLAANDAADFTRLDTVVSRGLASFVEVGRALQEIQQRKLYRAQYKTFESYVKQRHELSSRRAYQLIDAAGTVSQLENVKNFSQVPSTESHAKELSTVPEDDLPEVWSGIVERSETEGVPITARLIREHTEAYRDEGPEEEDGEEEEEGDWRAGVFDLAAAGGELIMTLTRLIERWPDEDKPTAAKFIRQTLDDMEL